MNALLDRFLNPDFYHPEALAIAAHGEIGKLSTSLLIVRLCLELRKPTTSHAEQVVRCLSAMQPVGYELFQFTTAQMIMTRRQNDKIGFMRALDGWLEGRATAPANWDDSVLQEPLFQSWLAEVDPEKLRADVKAVDVLSEEDRQFVKNVNAIPLKAVLANLEWLRQMNFLDAPEDIAKQFHLTHVNRYLKEATFDHVGEGPGFTIALDENGNYVDSFLSH
jgi:hypothetical protein